MKTSLTSFYRLSVRSAFVAAVLLACAPGTVKAHRNHSRVNKYGAPVVDANGHHISYDQKHLEALARTLGSKKGTNVTARPKSSMVKASGFVPTGGQMQQPFWQYAVFGAGIGLSNIIIGPTPPGGSPEILIGGDVQSGGDDFWQSIRYNTKSGTYDNVFVSSLYTPRGGDPYVAIARIGLAHVTNASDQQIVVMLEDGRIYLYDFATKTQVGFLDSGPFPFGSGLQGLSLTDLDDDGFAELIITTAADLYVFNGSGQLLWQVPGAGGVDVVAGRMDDDASLKIAATNGKVVDAMTHGVVWNYANGFGVRLKLAPFPGETYEQLISAEAWQFVYSYDVGRQLPRWSIPTPQDIGAIEVADLDNDGIPEVIIGDGQWGTVHVHDLITQALKWSVNNPDHGVTNIAVGDADNDGAVELLWGAGWTDTGPDHLYVASTTGGHDIEWQNLDLWAPFVGPAIGDLDGDGQPELVICSQGSELIDSGRILVFDLGTLALRAISQPILDGFAVYGVGDLKLRDVEGNGRLQIVIGTDSIYDGVIVVYRFDSNNTFTSIWTNSTLPQGSPIKFVEVADLDNNGTLKIIGGNYDAFGNGVYVYAYDYPSGVQSWQSVNLANSNSVAGLMVQDLDGNGSKEIAALTDSGDLYTWDGPTRQLRDLRQATSGTVLSDGATLAGLVLGDTSGVGHFWQWANNSYTETFTRQLSTECDPFFGCFNGINVAPDDSLWTGFGSTLNQRLAPSYDSVVWQSPGIGDGFGRFVATAARNGQNCVFSSARHAVMGLTYGPAGTPTPTPTPTASPSPTPTATGTPSPTATPTLTPTPRQTGTPRPRPTPAPRP